MQKTTSVTTATSVDDDDDNNNGKNRKTTNGTDATESHHQQLYAFPKAYQPETKLMLRDLGLLNAQDPAWLTRAIYQALFGDIDSAGHLVMLWLRTSYRYGGAKEPLHPGALLQFLATAPACLCLRHHRIGGRQRHAVYLFPFGVEGLAQHLAVPMLFADARIVRSVSLLLRNTWAFPQGQEDPVFGSTTFQNFAYAKEAQRKLDVCRPVLIAAAVRAVATQVRLETARTERVKATVMPRMRNQAWMSRQQVDAYVLSQTPTYLRAHIEQNVLAKVRRKALVPHASHWKHPGNRLLADTFLFVLDERKGQSLAYQPGYGGAMMKNRVPSLPYSKLPSNAEIRNYVAQVKKGWQAALKSLV